MEPHCNMAFVQPTISALAPMVVDTSTNKSHETKYFKKFKYNKIAALEERVRAIKGVDLYDPV